MVSGAKEHPGSAASAAQARAAVEKAYADAGLPHAIFKPGASQTHNRTSWDSRLGMIAHRSIGEIAVEAQALSLPERIVLVRSHVAGSMVNERNLGRKDKATVRVIGLVSSYLRWYLPPIGVAFVGAEVVLGGGRVDLAWEHPISGVFFDELKTWRHHQATLDAETYAQVHRYLDAGLALHGERFAGVRLLTLGSTTGCVAVTSRGSVEPLAASALAPALLAVTELAP